MSEISAAELYELYVDTVGRCTNDLLRMSDQDINYNLFEEFDVGARSYLHESALVKLRQAGYIDDEMLAASKKVREKWLALQNKPWRIEEVKTKEEWQ